MPFSRGLLLTCVGVFSIFMQGCLSQALISGTDECSLLVFGGGGVRGAWEVGAIKPLVQHLTLEKPRNWDVVGGVSAGSINAIATLYPGTDGTGDNRWVNLLWDKWSTTEASDISDVCQSTSSIITILGRKFWRWLTQGPSLGVCDSDPFQQTIRDVMAANGDVKEAGQAIMITAVRLEDGEVVPFDERNTEDELAAAVVASSTIPIVFEAAKIHGKTYVDGGIRSVVNVDAGVQKCASIAGIALNYGPSLAGDPECDYSGAVSAPSTFKVVVDYFITGFESEDVIVEDVITVATRSLEIVRTPTTGLSPLINAMRKYDFLYFRCIVSPTLEETLAMPSSAAFDDLVGRVQMLYDGLAVGSDLQARTQFLVDYYIPEDIRHRSVPCPSLATPV